MLRTIWMVIEGLLAAIGVFAVGFYILLIRKSMKDPKMLDMASDLGGKLCGKKQD